MAKKTSYVYLTVICILMSMNNDNVKDDHDDDDDNAEDLSFTDCSHSI